MTASNIYYYGSTQPLPETVALRAGPLSLVYSQGDLRYIKLGQREIIRRIYVAIRDRTWRTVLPVLSNVRMQVEPDSFEISYDAENKQDEIDFVWQGKITGGAQGTISLSMDGQARSSFWRNRIGFCILHPMRECAGTRCTIEKVDGSVEHSHFPQSISPHQPFLDMRSISHEVLPDLWAEVRFAGDTFEMEDQRNWTDASFKTYSTPLRIPIPVQIQQGTRILQTVTLTLKGSVPNQTGAGDTQAAPVSITLSDAPTQPLPRYGLGCASHGQPLTASEIARLKVLNLSHLRLDLDLTQVDFVAKLQQASDDGSKLGVPLEIALLLPEDAQIALQALAAALPNIKPRVWAWLVFSRSNRMTPAALVKQAREALAAYDPSAKWGTGSNVYFTELNRNRPTPATLGLVDFVSYAVTPQVHAFDNASVSEACETLGETIRTGQQFVAGKPLSISPATLKMRFNPSATGAETPPPPGTLPAPIDPRQMSLFGASWTLCSFKYIAESGGVQHVTYYETTGWRGVMEVESGSPLPEKFPSLAGAVFPLYHVFATLAEFVGGSVRPIRSSDPLQVDGMLLVKEGKTCLLLTNWTDREQPVQLQFGSQAVLRLLDSTTVEQAMRSPETLRVQRENPLSSTLSLPPYATAFIDLRV